VAAGAGMGVDSGLPDFRGPEGFWRAYPPYARLGLRFEELANPRWFHADPPLAWGFYGHRLNLYRRTAPHRGFACLRAWAERAPRGGFVFTSNIDGQFQRAGFAAERVVEVHGALDWLQCTRCDAPIFPAPEAEIAVDEETFRAREPLPCCPACGRLARPNVLMFGDGGWDGARSEAQADRLEAWLAAAAGARLVVIECGAGTAVPSVRRFSESLARAAGATLVRVNPREPEVPRGQISLPMGARAALEALEEACTSSP
jgi:NAD-dependent SIR2 family protein deacetylase